MMMTTRRLGEAWDSGGSGRRGTKNLTLRIYQGADPDPRSSTRPSAQRVDVADLGDSGCFTKAASVPHTWWLAVNTCYEPSR